MSEIGDVVTSTLHARTQLESILHGYEGRVAKLKAARERINQEGSSWPASFALSCAIGAEQDAATAIGKAIVLITQAIGHEEAAMAPPSDPPSLAR